MSAAEIKKFAIWTALACLPMHLPTSAQEVITPEVHRPAEPIGAELGDEKCGGFHIKARPTELIIRVDDPQSFCPVSDSQGDEPGSPYRFSPSEEYLWLRKGTHQITTCAVGMNPATFMVITIPGFVVDLNVELKPGSLCSGEATSTPVEYEVADKRPPDTQPVSADEPMEELRRRPRSADVFSMPVLNATCLLLRITPQDARVYIGGELVGSGQTLASGCIFVSERRRKIKIKHPSHRTWTTKLEIEDPGDSIQLEINLEKKGS